MQYSSVEWAFFQTLNKLGHRVQVQAYRVQVSGVTTGPATPTSWGRGGRRHARVAAFWKLGQKWTLWSPIWRGPTDKNLRGGKKLGGREKNWLVKNSWCKKKRKAHESSRGEAVFAWRMACCLVLPLLQIWRSKRKIPGIGASGQTFWYQAAGSRQHKYHKAEMLLVLHMGIKQPYQSMFFSHHLIIVITKPRRDYSCWDGYHIITDYGQNVICSFACPILLMFCFYMSAF